MNCGRCKTQMKLVRGGHLSLRAQLMGKSRPLVYACPLCGDIKPVLVQPSIKAHSPLEKKKKMLLLKTLVPI